MAVNERLYKVTNKNTGTVCVVVAYNRWQAAEFALKDEVEIKSCSALEAVSIDKARILYAIPQKE